ncbi:MAG TPA: hypothetical protein VEW95_06920 [Candidatus Limnocylindrales bacterium]|nr:hypothetical protein [Candidatus Limnocylindrales bacterium]
MLFPPATLQAIADGTVTLAFRRWDRPRVKAGGRQRTPVGVIAFDSVEAIEHDEITDADAVAAGFADRDELLGFVDRRASGGIYRIRLRVAGADPRVALRESLPDDGQLREIERRLARLDRASKHGPWTHSVLRIIHDQPEVRAAALAPELGRERLPFKLDVRKLKELGLTESLPRGYRLSPRGRATLEWLDGGQSRR